MGTSYTYVWEFRAAPEACAEFERHYGVDGTWTQLFRQAPGYIDTWLLKDRVAPGRYLTVDRWRDEASYLAFRAAFSREYAALDDACAALTTEERPGYVRRTMNCRPVAGRLEQHDPRVTPRRTVVRRRPRRARATRPPRVLPA